MTNVKHEILWKPARKPYQITGKCIKQNNNLYISLRYAKVKISSTIDACIGQSYNADVTQYVKYVKEEKVWKNTGEILSVVTKLTPTK